MVKKQTGGLTSLFGSSSKKDAGAVLPCPSSSSSMLPASSSSAWQWPSCGQPRTLSFRQQQIDGHHHTMKQAYKTMNSSYSVDSCFSNSFASVDSFSTASEASAPVDATEGEAEAVIRALRSDRLFFEPGASSCILKTPSKPKMKAVYEEDDGKDAMRSSATKAAFGGATAMSVESQNPYRDFRESMEAMVMSHGVKDWRWLEEMLGWYLRANGKSTHGLIVGAFVDLLVALSTTSAASSPATPTNCCSSSACSSSL
ncbi:transcription repressor OFP13-like [Phragmites australis]|uniref:transcription repressor OFP13-like n=1 Tax=Phragmites australis TaxID=29695 RepID=UPI002D78830F|nr:transcription repressor OFP13-like [Phragmites australis]XP_062195356.1 transcription repressor OFP13-like [Phragmites australis]